MKERLYLVIAAMVLLCTVAGIASAEAVTESVKFSGKLTDAGGNPLTGTYNVTFSLYDAATGGTALDRDTHFVTATNGKFTTTVTFDQAYYNGQALWVGIRKGRDPELKPRTAFRAVPYALGLRPGAFINASGINVTTSSTGSPGVCVVTTADNSQAFNANTYGHNSPAIDVAVHGDDSPAIRAYSDAHNSPAIRAWNDHTDLNTPQNAIQAYIGEKGIAVNVSMYDTDSYGYGAFGLGDNNKGLFVENWGFGGAGVEVKNHNFGTRGFSVTTESYESPAVEVETFGTESQGFEADTHGDSGSHGVDVTTTGNFSHGVVAQATGLESNGVAAYSTQWAAIYADTFREDHQWGLYTPDDIYANGAQMPASDVAEYMPAAGDADPGTVMIIGDDGILRVSTEANDPRVAGIVSTEPGVTLGANPTGNPGEEKIAVAGRVPCRVDATTAPIRPGDLLTTSDRPGFAMKAADPKIGTVLGKAMGSLESGTGVIDVLVTLQ